MDQDAKRMAQRTAHATPAPAKAILTPSIDLLCCGGLSILLIGTFLLYAQTLPAGSLSSWRLSDILIVHALINWPHFMASYRLLYRSREQISEHRWASIYIPLIILCLCIYALFTPIRGSAESEIVNGTVVSLVGMVGMFLLAWHYTGQAWGMTASFSYIAGIRMTRTERLLVRSGYRALLVWHLLWVLTTDYELSPALRLWTPNFYKLAILLSQFWTVVSLLTIVLGIIGFVMVRRRTGIRPPWRAVLPWVAIYFWYALIFFYPGAFAFVQISHALQYIIFPVRVEMNRYAVRSEANQTKQGVHAVIYFVALVVIGAVVHMTPDLAALLGDKQMRLSALVAGSVGLHHYFIDGAIWKISNPSVRKDLFSHLGTE